MIIWYFEGSRCKAAILCRGFGEEEDQRCIWLRVVEAMPILLERRQADRHHLHLWCWLWIFLWVSWWVPSLLQATSVHESKTVLMSEQCCQASDHHLSGKYKCKRPNLVCHWVSCPYIFGTLVSSRSIRTWNSDLKSGIAVIWNSVAQGTLSHIVVTSRTPWKQLLFKFSQTQQGILSKTHQDCRWEFSLEKHIILQQIPVCIDRCFSLDLVHMMNIWVPH